MLRRFKYFETFRSKKSNKKNPYTIFCSQMLQYSPNKIWPRGQNVSKPPYFILLTQLLTRSFTIIYDMLVMQHIQKWQVFVIPKIFIFTLLFKRMIAVNLKLDIRNLDSFHLCPYQQTFKYIFLLLMSFVFRKTNISAGIFTFTFFVGYLHKVLLFH